MKTPRFIPSQLIAALCFPWGVFLAAEPVDQSENVQNYIKHSEFIVDICVYEQEWIPATTEFPKAKWVMRAVVTGVHKGDIQVGTKLEYYHLIDDPPRLFKAFRSVVEGELRTFFFSSDDGRFQDGKYSLAGDGHFGFDRRKGDFAEAFRKELRINPELKRGGDQDASLPAEADRVTPTI
jgi:hypothetical protein